jgi:hypothetical protein
MGGIREEVLAICDRKVVRVGGSTVEVSSGIECICSSGYVRGGVFMRIIDILNGITVRDNQMAFFRIRSPIPVIPEDSLEEI